MKSKLSVLGFKRVGLAIGLILALILGAFVLLGCLAGCSTTRWVGIESGEYAVVSGRGEANEAARRAVQKMKIDRDERVAVFALVDGSEIVTSFVPRDRADWPDGCPTNLLIHRMEVLDLEEDTLTIGPIALNKPILVRDCPRDPMRVVLREDGEIGGGGGACAWPSECIFFGPRRERPWQADDSTVSTDQDSPVTFDLIASADEEYDKIDAGTFTVTNGPENGTAVNNLKLTGTITEDTGFNGTGTFIVRIVDLVTYTPNAGFHGTDVFTYRICDIDGTCDTATVTVTVSAVVGSLSLPRSMKGYELYSWYVVEEDTWYYTLVTGTNRVKSYAEISTSQGVITEDDWVKITVRGMNALRSVLDLLPAGEIVTWLDVGRLEGAPAVEEAFPDREVVREIERHYQRRGIRLDVVD